MKFGVDVDAVQRMNPTNFGHAPNCPLANQTPFTELVLPQLLEQLP